MDDLDVSNIIDKYINNANSSSDLLKWLIICKYAMEKILELGVEENWVKEIINDLISELAKLIISIRSTLDL